MNAAEKIQDEGAPLLQILSVSKTFGGVKALTEVGFEVAPATIQGVIGPNGAGKTTLFNLISGFYPPDQGTIRYDGRDTGGRSNTELVRLGITRTFQLWHHQQESGQPFRKTVVRMPGPSCRAYFLILNMVPVAGGIFGIAAIFDSSVERPISALRCISKSLRPHFLPSR